jgi:peptidyl serine alpha-galactosyltransferase
MTQVRTMPHLYWSINGSIPNDIPTGDAYVKRGKAPWISEMYGYAFGAATAGVSHVITHGVVRYPSEVGKFGDVEGAPYILHYGIDFNLGEYLRARLAALGTNARHGIRFDARAA